VATGFVGFEIIWRADVFSGAPQSSSAADFGTLGINFRARKALNEDEWAEALLPSAARFLCSRPHSLAPTASTMQATKDAAPAHLMKLPY